MTEKIPSKIVKSDSKEALEGCNETEDFGLSIDDEAALDLFCAAVDLEEIPFEDWENTHHSLDLCITKEISFENANKPNSVEIGYVQTSFVMTPKKTESLTKKRASHLLNWKIRVEDGQSFVVKGAGDQRENQQGDLKITIKIKR